MAALWAEAWALPGVWALFMGVVLAGLVRGFTGFGTALVYLPIASQVLPPVWVLITLLVMDILGPLPAVPRALRDGHPADVARLGGGAMLGVPLGVAVLVALSSEPFRWAVSLITLGLVAALVLGLRWRGRVTRPMVYGTGFVGGTLAGAVGLPGPPVILFYMARAIPPAAIRANLMLYLIVADILMLGVLGWRGLIEALPVLLGVLLIPAYLGMVVLGTRLFDPNREALYRRTAYVIITLSALSGLPIWT